ncbi:hypothetical protein C8Q78DRAFT_207607 [Trametes maxima]|nr:hypothetical protein C8Q78DRAFT_207607 [Trametes maxima]
MVSPVDSLLVVSLSLRTLPTSPPLPPSVDTILNADTSPPSSSTSRVLLLLLLLHNTDCVLSTPSVRPPARPSVCPHASASARIDPVREFGLGLGLGLGHLGLLPVYYHSSFFPAFCATVFPGVVGSVNVEPAIFCPLRSSCVRSVGRSVGRFSHTTYYSYYYRYVPVSRSRVCQVSNVRCARFGYGRVFNNNVNVDLSTRRYRVLSVWTGRRPGM